MSAIAYNPARRTDAEIQEVLDIGGKDNVMRHRLFARLILGEDWLFAIYAGHHFEEVPLTLPVARVIADGWCDNPPSLVAGRR